METTTTTAKLPSQVLNECADLLENGTLIWKQGNYFKALSSLEKKAAHNSTTTGCQYGVCAWGALEYCLSDKIRNAFDLGSLPSFGCMSLNTRETNYMVRTGMSTGWNDMPGRTVQEVISKFREAAKLALSEGN